MTGLGTREIRKIIEDSRFEYDVIKKPIKELVPVNVNMTIWHEMAIFFTRTVAKRTGTYSFSELKDTVTERRCDVFIVASGIFDPLIIQWEPYSSPQKEGINYTFFSPDVEVFTYSYNELWTDFSTMSQSAIFKKWCPRFYLPIPPEKFDWNEYHKHVNKKS
jgi:hypothetical protein